MIIRPADALDGIGLIADGDAFGFPGGVAIRALAIAKEEIIDHDLIKKPGGVLKNRLEPGLCGLVGVTAHLGPPAAGGLAKEGRRHAAGDENSRRAETVARTLEGLAVSAVTISKHLDINMGDAVGFAPAHTRVDISVGGQAVKHVLSGEKGKEAVDGRGIF